jgi:hypothetical protein
MRWVQLIVFLLLMPSVVALSFIERDIPRWALAVFYTAAALLALWTYPIWQRGLF